MARLEILPAARRDLIEIGDYIALDNRPRAASFIAEIEAEIVKIAANPRRFPARNDLLPGLRAARHGRYLIFFFDQPAEIQIVRVLHGARDAGTALADLGGSDPEAEAGPRRRSQPSGEN